MDQRTCEELFKIEATKRGMEYSMWFKAEKTASGFKAIVNKRVVKEKSTLFPIYFMNWYSEFPDSIFISMQRPDGGWPVRIRYVLLEKVKISSPHVGVRI